MLLNMSAQKELIKKLKRKEKEATAKHINEKTLTRCPIQSPPSPIPTFFSQSRLRLRSSPPTRLHSTSNTRLLYAFILRHDNVPHQGISDWDWDWETFYLFVYVFIFGLEKQGGADNPMKQD